MSQRASPSASTFDILPPGHFPSERVKTIRSFHPDHNVVLFLLISPFNLTAEK